MLNTLKTVFYSVNIYIYCQKSPRANRNGNNSRGDLAVATTRCGRAQPKHTRFEMLDMVTDVKFCVDFKSSIGLLKC